MCFKSVLASLLDERGLKQSDLVAATGIPSSLISNYLKGVKSPGLKNALKIANALGVSLEMLSGKKPTLKKEDSTLGSATQPRAERILAGFERLKPEFQEFVLKKIDELLAIQDDEPKGHNDDFNKNG